MKLIALLILLKTPSAEVKAWAAAYTITQVKPKPTLAKNMAEIVFTLNAPDKCAKNKTVFRIDNGKYTSVYNKKGKAVQLLLHGKHILRFIAPGCDTIVTDTIDFKKQTSTAITLTFTTPDKSIKGAEMITFKPVIYIYPEKETPYHLQLHYNGELTFTYPPAINGEWDVLAQNNGTLVYNNKMFNYLFWDGTMNENSISFDKTKGFCVTNNNLVSFFENKLSEAGLNSKEIADFITFWVPKMSVHENCFVHFLFTPMYDQIATLNIEPKPDNVLRLYMLWSPVPQNKNIVVSPQNIPVFNREKSTLIEWGGSEMLQFFNDL